jgi:hypothetical protein
MTGNNLQNMMKNFQFQIKSYEKAEQYSGANKDGAFHRLAET